MSPKAPTRTEHPAIAQRWRDRRASFCSSRRSARRWEGVGDAPTGGLSDYSVHPADMALI